MDKLTNSFSSSLTDSYRFSGFAVHSHFRSLKCADFETKTTPLALRSLVFCCISLCRCDNSQISAWSMSPSTLVKVYVIPFLSDFSSVVSFISQSIKGK